MTDETVIVLNAPSSYTQARSAVTRAPEGAVVKIGPAKRSLEQNARLHAMIGDVVKSGHKLHGLDWNADDWKTFFVSAWMGETGKRSRIVKGINGEVVQLYWRTSTMTKEQLGEVMIIVERFCAENGITLREGT